MKADRSIRLLNESDKDGWDRVVVHPLQSWEWGEFRRAMGVDVVRVGVYSGPALTAAWQLTFHALPHTSRTVGYFPKGPVPDEFMLERLHEIGRSKKAIFIQLEPDSTDLANAIFRHKLLLPSHRSLFTKYTFRLDISRSEEELLAAMHPKTRYNIRVAQKKGVVINEDSSETAFAAYLRLSEETTRRQGFYAHNTRYHTTMWNQLKNAGIAKLFTATYEHEVLAAWIVFIWNDTVYYPYGASSRLHKDVMAPNVLLWEIVRWAKSKKLKYFDLWGALGKNPDPADPWYGFHRFKEGYRPDLIEFVGSYDEIIEPALYKLYTVADKARWTILKLKKR
jgi:lipid II:glycine glycyltransferase (peptidoglycan interpeptide bridge formation enzyme)